MRAKADKRHSRAKGEVHNLKPMLRYLRPYKGMVIAACIAVVFTSSAVLALGSGVRYLVDEGLNKGNTELLDRSFYYLIAIIFGLAMATYARFFLVSTIGEKVVRDIRNDVYRHLVQMHIGFYETTRIGEILSRLTTDTSILQVVIGSSLSVAARNALLLIGGVALLLITSSQLTEYVFIILPMVIVPIVLIGRAVRVAARDAQDKVADVSAHAEESLNAIRTVQGLTLEPYQNQHFSLLTEAAYLAQKKRIHLRARLTAIVIMLVFGAVAMVLWFGGKDVVAGRITTGELSAFLFYSVVVAGATGAISEVWADIQRAAGAAERISELLAEIPEISSPADAKLMASDNGAAVRFEQVSFAYPMRPEKPAIANIDLDIEAGKTIAFVGPSGAGKTTMFQLLMRFYDPQQGRICICGEDIRDVSLADLRSMIGLVPQEPFIFSGTARENIRFGNMNADDATIDEAARAASAMEFLEKLPEGLDTHIGEKGIQLSGGQRQRLAIARALVRDPKILLLDEATSALDSENEHAIQQALLHVMQGRTTFVIAHRLSTVRRADAIILLADGEIQAMGTHDELIKNNELYERLARLQFHSETL